MQATRGSCARRRVGDTNNPASAGVAASAGGICRPRWLCAIALSLLCLAVATSPAAGQQPVSPADGEQVTARDVVLRWTLAPGSYTTCVEWASRPETSYQGGPFLRSEGRDCFVGPRDEAYLLELERARPLLLARRSGPRILRAVWGFL